MWNAERERKRDIICGKGWEWWGSYEIKAGDKTKKGYEFTFHTAEQANDRKYTIDDIDDIITNWDDKGYQYGGKIVYIKNKHYGLDVTVLNVVLNTSNLSEMDRMYLMSDALSRASDAGVNIKITDTIRRILYGYWKEIYWIWTRSIG